MSPKDVLSSKILNLTTWDSRQPTYKINRNLLPSTSLIWMKTTYHWPVEKQLTYYGVREEFVIFTPWNKGNFVSTLTCVLTTYSPYFCHNTLHWSSFLFKSLGVECCHFCHWMEFTSTICDYFFHIGGHLFNVGWLNNRLLLLAGVPLAFELSREG